jgi:hypothetical protein
LTKGGICQHFKRQRLRKKTSRQNKVHAEKYYIETPVNFNFSPSSFLSSQNRETTTTFIHWSPSLFWRDLKISLAFEFTSVSSSFLLILNSHWWKARENWWRFRVDRARVKLCNELQIVEDCFCFDLLTNFMLSFLSGCLQI